MDAETNTTSPQNQRSTFVALLAANAFPALGVLFWGWDAFLTVSVYFAETMIIGVYTWVRILTATGAPDPDAEQKVETLAGRIYLSLFFTVHYGMFVGVQTVFMVVALGPSSALVLGAQAGENVLPWLGEFALAILLLFISHGYSLVVHWFRGGERHRIDPLSIMGKPYGRIFLQQFLVIFGCIIIHALDAHAGTVFILMLVAMKTAADATMHLRSHQKVTTKITADGVELSYENDDRADEAAASEGL
jgi:hypothetical protein